LGGLEGGRPAGLPSVVRASARDARSRHLTPDPARQPMNRLHFDRLRTILCLGAHADDIEIGCGGTLLALLAACPSLRVHWVVLSADELRAEEARQSARRILGAAAHEARIQVEGFRDAFFPYPGTEIKEYFQMLRTQVEPDLIFTHRREDLHQDHRLVAELTWNAFRQHLILEYEIPKYEGDLGQPNVFVPLAEPVARAKVEHLLEAFPSQRTKPWFVAETFWALLRLRGLEAGAPTPFAEAFHGRKLTLGQ
jgi:LmbE family N-acetylglucosaminyl deacetylase